MFFYKRRLFFYLKCKKNNIPIIRKQTANYIYNFINENKISSLLEIGTAYGFSSYLFSTNKNIKRILSVEKNKKFFLIAKKELKNNKKIELINIDAFEFNINEKFDSIFLDGPKSNQIKLVQKFLPFLNKNGVIFIDNLYLKKIRNIPYENRNKNQKKIIEKLDLFLEFLKSSKDFEFTLIDIDDGLGIIKRINNE